MASSCSPVRRVIDRDQKRRDAHNYRREAAAGGKERGVTLIETHRDLSEEQSALVNAQLILLLANHIGDVAVLRQALALARAGV